MNKLMTSREPEVAPMNPEAIETDEFKLEILDCGPAYSYGGAESVCFSCVCGNGCLCGSA